MKKLFALLLAITMMATLSVTAFAADYDTAGEKGMTVTYSVAHAPHGLQPSRLLRL